MPDEARRTAPKRMSATTRSALIRLVENGYLWTTQANSYTRFSIASGTARALVARGFAVNVAGHVTPTEAGRQAVTHA